MTRSSPESQESPTINVAGKERILSVISGAVVLGYGIFRRSRFSPIFTIVGGILVRRGLSGRCTAYRRLGVDTAQQRSQSGVADGEGFRIEKSIEIDRTPSKVFGFWRDLENPPRFMPHLKSVEVLSDRVSHWTVEGPTGPVEWDAEIINEHPGSMLAWQTLPGADVRSAGNVRFEPTANGGATKVTVVLRFQPPAAGLGAVVARIFGTCPGQQLEEDLVRYKMLLENDPDPPSSQHG